MTPDDLHAMMSRFFAARVTVEQRLLDHGNGKKPITSEEAYELADLLSKADSIASELLGTVTAARGYCPVYGYCPKCGVPGVSREQRPNGYDRCGRGHRYLSSTALIQTQGQHIGETPAPLDHPGLPVRTTAPLTAQPPDA